MEKIENREGSLRNCPSVREQGENNCISVGFWKPKEHLCGETGTPSASRGVAVAIMCCSFWQRYHGYKNTYRGKAV
jgi:hypothetical protein